MDRHATSPLCPRRARFLAELAPSRVGNAIAGIATNHEARQLPLNGLAFADSSRHNRSMEQEVRDLLEGYVAERRAVLDQIEAGWAKQGRRPTAAEVDAWMAVGRP